MKRRIAVVLAALDCLCVLAGLIVAWQVWLWSAPNLQRLIQPGLTDLLLPNPWMPSGLVCLVAWVAALAQLGLLDPGRMENSVRIASSIWRSTLYMALFILVMNFIGTNRVYPRSLISTFLVATWAILTLSRLLIFRLLLRLPVPPTAAGALIVGTGEDGFAMAERITTHARHVCRMAGYLRTSTDEPVIGDSQILGEIKDLPAIVNQHDVHILILAARYLAREDAMKLAVQADRMGLRVLQAPYSWGVVSPRLGFSKIGGLELIDLVGVRYPTLGEQVKRAFDLVAVLLGGLLILPLLLLVALMVRLQDGGPVFYLSKRVGRGGRIFDFYKFRSMVVNADALRTELPNEADGRLFKLKKIRASPLLAGGSESIRWTSCRNCSMSCGGT